MHILHSWNAMGSLGDAFHVSTGVRQGINQDKPVSGTPNCVHLKTEVRIGAEIKMRLLEIDGIFVGQLPSNLLDNAIWKLKIPVNNINLSTASGLQWSSGRWESNCATSVCWMIQSPLNELRVKLLNLCRFGCDSNGNYSSLTRNGRHSRTKSKRQFTNLYRLPYLIEFRAIYSLIPFPRFLPTSTLTLSA